MQAHPPGPGLPRHDPSVIREAFFIAFGTHHDKYGPVLAMTATESGCFRALGNGGNPNWSLIRGCHNSLIPIRLYLNAVGFLYNISVGFLDRKSTRLNS